MKTVVLKIGNCEYFDEAVDIFKTQGFKDIEI